MKSKTLIIIFKIVAWIGIMFAVYVNCIEMAILIMLMLIYFKINN